MSTRRYFNWTERDLLLMEELYARGHSTREIGVLMGGATGTTISYHLRKRGVPMRPRGTQTERQKMRGERHPGWRGGRRRDHGYIRLFRPEHPFAVMDGSVPEHRVVVEDVLREVNPQHPAMCDGYLRPDWIVHHRNGVKDDNRYENLEPLPRSAHHSWMHYHDRIAELEAALAKATGDTGWVAK